MYRLKIPSHQIAMVLSALAEGLDPSAAEQVFGFRQATITTWLTRAGTLSSCTHAASAISGSRICNWMNCEHGSVTIHRGSGFGLPSIPSRNFFLHVGPRTQQSAHTVIHCLRQILATSCIPVFTSELNTAFIERVNLTVRHGVAALARRTWATAQQSPHLLAYLEWWRAYYHFVRPHESLRVALLQPRERGGKLVAQRYRQRTPAMAAGRTTRRWTTREVLACPLPKVCA